MAWKTRSSKNPRSKIIKKIDEVVSRLVRTRDNWTCVRCHTRYTPPTSALHCSHFYSRRYLGTRFDLENLDALCFGCHRLVESDKQEQGWYAQFKRKQLGDKGYEALHIRAYAQTKIGLYELELLLDIVKKQLQELSI